VENNGWAYIVVDGEARVSLSSLVISIPVEQEAEINVYEEVQKRIEDYLRSEGIIGSDVETGGSASGGEGEAVVASVLWLYGGRIVYEVPQGSEVTVRVVLRAEIHGY